MLTINNGPTAKIKDKCAWQTNIKREIQTLYQVPRKQADAGDMCPSSPQPSVSLHTPGDKWRKGQDREKSGAIMAQPLHPACKFVHYIATTSLMWSIMKRFGLGFDIGSRTMADFAEGRQVGFVWNWFLLKVR